MSTTKQAKNTQPAAQKTRNRAGRPPIEFDLAAVEGLGRIGATAVEMAHILPASQSTIEHRMADRESDFSKAYQRGRSLLNGSVRRKQIEVAMAGNVTMLIWLGKQLIGQTDRAEHAIEHLNLDVSSLTDDQLARLAKGESLASVLGRG